MVNSKNRMPIGVRSTTNWHPIGHHSRLSGSNRGEGVSNLTSTAILHVSS